MNESMKNNSVNKIELKNITKSFLNGQIIANDNVSISFKAGEVHSLVGENGSGKSTLMSILFGLYNLDSGQIFVDGKKVNMYDQGASAKYKIGMVHQHFHLVENFTVIENIIVGQEKKYRKGPFLNKKKILEHYNEITKKYNINLDSQLLVKKLNIGDRQKVEILKTLWEKKEVLIFDEPTATLSVREIKLFLKIIEQLKAQGILVIFVSHKLQEVKKISDRISILKRGKLVGTYQNDKKLTPSEISRLMIGQIVKIKFNAPVAKSNVILKVENLNYYTSRGFHAVRDVNFTVHEDEIFGLAGIEGNGQEEILNSIAGLKTPDKNSKILFKDNNDYLKDAKIRKIKKEENGFFNVTNLPIKYKQKFMSHVPIDRFKYGILLNKSIKYNSIISDFGSAQFAKKYNWKFNKSIIMDEKKIYEWSKEIVDKYNVEGVKNVNQLIRNLSGGNQQKFVYGREASNRHALFLVGYPTRGLDINAINNIYKDMIENSKGKATILYSLEISELIEVCTRIAILYKGQIVKIIKPKEYSFETISRMLVGEFNE